MHPVLALLALALVAAACGPDAPVPSASYDTHTRRLVQMASDLDRDGRLDHWAYLDGARLLRAEIDADGDGRIDRWEYYDAAGALLRVGSASRGDGVEDEWTWAATAAGDRRVDTSTARDGRADRREVYRGDRLVRRDEDITGDGRIDRWQVFEDGQLREVGLDTTGRGRPDRRLRYDAAGAQVSLEIDVDGSGTFVAAPVSPAAPVRP